MKKQKEVIQDIVQQKSFEIISKLAQVVDENIKAVFPVWQQKLIEKNPKLFKFLGIGLRIEQRIIDTPDTMGRREYTIKRFGKVVRKFAVNFTMSFEGKKKEVKKK